MSSDYPAASEGPAIPNCLTVRVGTGLLNPSWIQQDRFSL